MNQPLDVAYEPPGRDAAAHLPGAETTGTTREQIARLPDDVLKESVIAAKRMIDRAHAELTCLVAELDTRQLTDIDHALSTTAWIRHFCQMTSTEASGTVKTARALDHMPSVTDAALQGQIPHRSVQLLSQARDRHPDAFRGHETVFADVATYLSVKDLRRAVSHWEQQVDYAGALDETDTAHQRRRFYFNKTYLGMWNATGDLDPESGHVIATALHGHTDPANLDPDDRRTMPQRNADALTDICRFWLDHNNDTAISGGERPHITVTVPYATLIGDEQRLGEIDGTAINPETIRRWACDAGIVRIVLDGDSQPIDVGRRTRTISPSLRRALELRDGGCVWAGCDAPASWCDAHHIIHWADGGTTTLDNLILLCRKHHTAVHNGKEPPPRSTRVETPHVGDTRHRSRTRKPEP